jgi:outer membrane lipoprotein-sorting protein
VIKLEAFLAKLARAFSCAVVSALCCTSALHAQTAMAALNRAEAAYRGMQTLRAEFSQTLENPMMGASVSSRGTLFLAPPSRFAMRFADPAGDRIVSDGSWLWVHLPSSVPNQVIRQVIPNRGAATPNLLAQFVDRPLEHYLASYVGSDRIAGDVVDVVRLVPRRDDDPFNDAEVAIARGTGLVRRLMVVEPAGQRRTILFDRLQINIDIPEAELRFVVPDGTRVIVP